ncbi:hypothetical protein F8388_002930 [Cannabis sativa]|uniref:DUF4283 domain-containing protein n=1 Tax=Cannabis sativa TaxID=3483 RepID=A0A7J6H5K4_CANSA|nr:hypothetical protein F8388_002930 [Cannabis sativa]
MNINCDGSGKVISRRAIFKDLLRNVLAQKWRLAKGWNMAEEEPNVYTLKFQRKADAEFVVDRSPWEVCGGHLILKPFPDDVVGGMLTWTWSRMVAKKLGGVISIDRLWKNVFLERLYSVQSGT